MTDSIQFFASGVLLGLAAGVSPGPLVALVLSETLLHGRKAGLMVSAAPAVTDVPIIFLSLSVLSCVTHSNLFLGGISLAGSLFIGHLAYKNMSLKAVSLSIQDAKGKALRRGVMTNLLSPHPYLFWLTIGSPILMKAHERGLDVAVSFVIGFYLLLIGSKMLLAVLVGISRQFLQGRAYRVLIRTTGLILMGFAILFLKECLHLFGFL